MGENICKWSDWQEINLQNIRIAYADQYKKKWVEDLDRYLSKENIDMIKKYMKSYITSLITRETQIKKKSEVSPHTCQTGHH